MSHLKERIEKDCLNCGTNVQGRFCQQCGQENVEVKESFLQLIKHFLADLTHFDGKLWKTLKFLLFQPGKLTQFYMDGKRAAYIHPIRMYLFISAVFFLFMFTGDVPDRPEDIPANATPKADFASGLSEGFKLNIGEDSVNFKTIAEYNAAQQKLPVSKRANWIESSIEKKSIEINQKYNRDKFKIGKALLEQFEHYFSRMLYISLPIFSLFLWVLYRRNNNHYFVDHLIFSIHIYCSFFIFLFVVKLINIISELLFKKTFDLVLLVTPMILFYYSYKALRNHYNQSRAKTLLKFFILNILTMLLMVVLMTAFILLSLFNI
jgi:hypothetical protein